MIPEQTHIEALSLDTEPLWDEYVRKHSEGSFYHQLWWRDLFRNSFRFEPHYLMARRGTKVAGVMPLFKTPTLRGSLMTSIPFRDRAAPLADDVQTLEKLLRRALDISRDSNCNTILVKSISPLTLGEDLKAVFAHSSDWIRSVASLPSDQETFWKRINDKTRNMIRQAQKAGLEFSLVNHDAETAEAAVAVLRKTQHRLGIPPFSKAYYLNLVERLVRDKLGEICTVKNHGRVIAAAILFFENSAAIYAYAGSLPEAWPLRANDFLVWKSLVLAIERGKMIFDFGSDSSRQDNLLFFKKKWGADQTPLHYYSHNIGAPGAHSYVWRDSSQGLYPFLRSVVRMMPSPVYNLMGSLTRYFA